MTGATIVAAYAAMVRAGADLLLQENTSNALERAARIAPGNAAIHLALAIQQELAGSDPSPALWAAARLDPLLAEPWLRLGLLAESHGDLQSAEQLLLQSTAVSRQFLPRATLMAFYFRRQNAAAFWYWARQSLEMSYGDRGPIFDLCWRMAGDPAEVLTKAIPRNHDVLRAYVEYLVMGGRLPAALEAAEALLAQPAEADRRVALELCERLMSASPGEALRLWNRACRTHLLPYEPLDPAVHASLVNGRFGQAPLQSAFDWKVVQAGDIPTTLLPDGGIEFAFSGRQANVLELLSQTMPLRASRHYRVVAEYQTESVGIPTGIFLTLEDPIGRRPLQESQLISTEEPAAAAVVFAAPASGYARLCFRYGRPLGMVRTDGKLMIRGIRLEAAP